MFCLRFDTTFIDIDYGHMHAASMMSGAVLLAGLASVSLCIEQQVLLGPTATTVHFSREWDILGPFQIGTRGK